MRNLPFKKFLNTGIINLALNFKTLFMWNLVVMLYMSSLLMYFFLVQIFIEKCKFIREYLESTENYKESH